MALSAAERVKKWRRKNKRAEKVSLKLNITKTLREALKKEASRRDISLNDCAVNILTKGV